MNGALGHFYALSRLNWARGQLGLMRWIWDETLPQSSIDRSTLHSAAHRATKWASGRPQITKDQPSMSLYQIFRHIYLSKDAICWTNSAFSSERRWISSPNCCIFASWNQVWTPLIATNLFNIHVLTICCCFSLWVSFVLFKDTWSQ